MTKRVLTAQIKHETNTFSILPTTLDSYRARVLYEGDELKERLKGTNNELAGVMDVAAEKGWELVTPIAGDATPSGKVSSEAWEYLASAVFNALKNDGPFDAVLISLHGPTYRLWQPSTSMRMSRLRWRKAPMHSSHIELTRTLIWRSGDVRWRNCLRVSLPGKSMGTKR